MPFLSGCKYYFHTWLIELISQRKVGGSLKSDRFILMAYICCVAKKQQSFTLLESENVCLINTWNYSFPAFLSSGGLRESSGEAESWAGIHPHDSEEVPRPPLVCQHIAKSVFLQCRRYNRFYTRIVFFCAITPCVHWLIFLYLLLWDIFICHDYMKDIAIFGVYF